MRKVLGIDLGTNSIGWALIATEKNSLLQSGGRISSISNADKRVVARQIRRRKKRFGSNSFTEKISLFDKKSIALKALTAIMLLTTFLTLTNNSNWQFWLNITMTSLVAMLTIMYQDNK